jgi:hypothetical protein
VRDADLAGHFAVGVWMTRLSNKLKRLAVEEFKSGVSMELLAERLRVGILQIETVIRDYMRGQGGKT